MEAKVTLEVVVQYWLKAGEALIGPYPTVLAAQSEYRRLYLNWGNEGVRIMREIPGCGLELEFVIR